MAYKYYSMGSESEMEGLTLACSYVDEEAGIYIGMNDTSKWYKCKEITKEEYDAYRARLRAPGTKLGMYGLVNDTGHAVYREYLAEQEAARRAAQDKKINLFVRRLQRMLDAKFVLPEEVDDEIATANMTACADSIKSRLTLPETEKE